MHNSAPRAALFIWDAESFGTAAHLVNVALAGFRKLPAAVSLLLWGGTYLPSRLVLSPGSPRGARPRGLLSSKGKYQKSSLRRN